MAVSDHEMEAPVVVKRQKERERMIERNEEKEEAGSCFNVLYLFYQ